MAREMRCRCAEVTFLKSPTTHAVLDQEAIQRKHLEEIVSSVPAIVFEAWGEPDSSSQRTQFVNAYVETMLGYSVSEWLSNPNLWLTIVHPDDKENAARDAAALYATRRGGKMEFRWIAKDGRIVWSEANLVVLL